VVVAIIALLIGILLPSLSRAREIANRTVCASNLNGLYKAMYTYSVTNSDKFHIAGAATSGQNAVGFATGLSARNVSTVTTGAMANNVTASIWMMVRDGSVSPKSFICPSSGNTPDPLTQAATTNSADLKNTFDFLKADHLSYSPLNMYGTIQSKKWGSNVPADYALVADNNNCASTDAKRHTQEKNTNPATTDVQEHENSLNHQKEGQNIMFGDGHVSFGNDPFQGRNNDNVFASDSTSSSDGAESAVVPSIANNQSFIQALRTERDSMLLPVTGNTSAANLDPAD
jgi:prepilin-type processing-associated H-X9-DG protein